MKFSILMKFLCKFQHVKLLDVQHVLNFQYSFMIQIHQILVFSLPEDIKTLNFENKSVSNKYVQYCQTGIQKAI